MDALEKAKEWMKQAEDSSSVWGWEFASELAKGWARIAEVEAMRERNVIEGRRADALAGIANSFRQKRFH